MEPLEIPTKAPRHSGRPISTTRPPAETLLAYFSDAAPKLLTPPEGILEHPSIAFTMPGSQYSASRWDWDTLITMQGLFRCAELNGDVALRDDIAEHGKGSLLNFLDRQSEEGRLPIMVSINDHDPFRCLEPAATPNHRNQAKPIFGQMVVTIAEATDDWQWAAPLLDKLVRFYDSWTRNNMSHVGLYVWGDDVAIGNDNDPATFGRPFFSSAALLLNTVFWRDLRASAKLARQLDRPEDAQRLDDQAEALGADLLRHCWDRARQLLLHGRYAMRRHARGADQVSPRHGHELAMPAHQGPVVHGFPAALDRAGHTRAGQALIDVNYLADDRFRCDWGVRSLSSLENMYTLEFSSNPSNWLGPVWVLINHIVWKALRQYGYADAAADLASKTVTMLASDIETNGYVSEFYHPDSGLPVGHKAYLDWNLLALDMIEDGRLAQADAWPPDRRRMLSNDSFDIRSSAH